MEDGNLKLKLCEPKNLEDYFINTEIVNKLKKFADDKIISNYIFYGKEGSGKYSLVMALLSSIYGDSVYIIKNIEYQIVNPISKKNEMISVKTSKYHYELDVRDYYINDNTIVNSFIKMITNTCNIETNSYHIIIIRNVQYLSKTGQDSIKSFLEKRVKTCRLIFITQDIFKIADSLKSRCISIRIPLPSESDIAKLSLTIVKNNKVEIKLEELKKIIQDSENNLNKLKFILTQIILSGKYIEYIDPYKEIILSIPKLIKKKKNITIFNEIREILMNLLVCNIQPNFIFNNLLSYYTKSSITDKSKRDIVTECAFYELNCQKGYRQLYHIEAFIAKIVLILENNSEL